MDFDSAASACANGWSLPKMSSKSDYLRLIQIAGKASLAVISFGWTVIVS